MRHYLQCGRFGFHLDQHALIMGVLNVTPDSFSDGGHFLSLEMALEHAELMMGQGVHLIDIGGESSRPGAPVVAVAEELHRVMPLLFGLRDLGVPLSVDTCKPEVMREAILAGADMINDIKGFTAPGAIEAVAKADCALCIMHMQNDPQTMQTAPRYGDVLGEVIAFLQVRVEALLAAGIDRQRLCVDPGFGFGKSLEHNLILLRGIGRIEEELGLAVLAGLSRKSMIGAITGKPVEQRLAGSLAAALAAIAQGAKIVRVHDVAETADALKVWQAAQH